MALATIGPSNWKDLGGDEHLAVSVRDRMSDALLEGDKDAESAWIVGRLLLANQVMGHPEGQLPCVEADMLTVLEGCTMEKPAALWGWSYMLQVLAAGGSPDYKQHRAKWLKLLVEHPSESDAHSASDKMVPHPNLSS